MKKLIMSCGNPQYADDFITINRKNLKKSEYFTIEKRIHENWSEYRVYIVDGNCEKTDDIQHYNL